MRIGHRDNHRLFREIEPSARIERIKIGPDNGPHVSSRIGVYIGESIHRSTDRSLAGRRVNQLLSRQIHRHGGIEIKIGIDGDIVCFLWIDGLSSDRR